MSANNELKGSVVILDLPRRTGEIITHTKAICKSLENHTLLLNPTPTLDELKAEVHDLEDAAVNASARTVGTTALRAAKEKRVRRALGRFCSFVQSIVDENPSQAAVIVESVHMRLRKVPQRSSAELVVKNGPFAGQAVLRARRMASQATYYWEFSLNQTDWTAVPETIQASTVISGLPSRTDVYFRFRALTRKGKGDYSQVVSLLMA